MTARNSRSTCIAVVLVSFLVALLVPAVTAQAKDCSKTSTGLVPLTDLGTDTYQGEVGGLYPDGSNEIPSLHLQLGLELAAQVIPRAEDGTPNENGAIGFISIGVSTTAHIFKAFIEKAAASEINPALVLVDGAQIGRPLNQWARESSTRHPAWDTLEDRIARQGLTAEQIQVAWVMLPSSTRGPRTLSDARDEMEQLTRVLQVAKERYPNLVLTYLSSLVYMGYVPESDSEPNGYHHGFQVKWLIEEQIDGSPALNPDPARGAVLSPWIAWGGYLWADGTTPRSDGLVWTCEDFAGQGLHLAPGASEKPATLVMEHFFSDQTATGWFPATVDRNPANTTSLPATTLASTPGSSSHSTPETTLGLVPSTGQDIGAAEENSDSQESSDAPNQWLWAAIGVGVLLALGAFVGVIRRAPTDRP